MHPITTEHSRFQLRPGALHLCFLAVLATFATVPVRGQSAVPQRLADASLEDQMKIDVTSVSNKEQSLSRTGAAVFVISREDIRRSGAVNIPDLLRMAWGAKAVNGVINVITSSSADTKGALVAAGTGTRQSAQGLIQ